MVAGLPAKGETMSTPSKCPLCGGTLEADREVERVVREGDDVALVRVRADVCGDCHEALLHPGMVERMFAAKAALRAKAEAPVVGCVYDLRTGTSLRSPIPHLFPHFAVTGRDGWRRSATISARHDCPTARDHEGGFAFVNRRSPVQIRPMAPGITLVFCCWPETATWDSQVDSQVGRREVGRRAPPRPAARLRPHASSGRARTTRTSRRSGAPGGPMRSARRRQAVRRGRR